MQETAEEGEMDSLPDELLLKIFSNMRLEEIKQNVAQVNSRWHKISQDPSLNVSVTRKYEKQMYCDSDLYFSLMSEINSGHLVRSIILSNLFLNNVNGFLTAVANSCPALEVLQVYLHVDSVYEKTLQLVTTKCPLITELVLHAECDTSESIASLKFLKKLRFKRYRFCLEPIEETYVRNLTEKCEYLEELHITKREMTHQAFSYLVDKKGAQITSLGIRPQLSSEFISHLKQLSHSLVSLKIDLLNQYPQKHFKILEEFVSLKHLTIISSAEFGMEDILPMFVTKCPFENLLSLKLKGFGRCDNEALERISEHLGNLTTFVLEGGAFVTNDGLYKILIANKKLSILKLELLDEGVTNSCILKAMTELPYLNTLKIKYCSGFSRESLKEMTNLKPNLNVKFLEMGRD